MANIWCWFKNNAEVLTFFLLFINTLIVVFLFLKKFFYEFKIWLKFKKRKGIDIAQCKCGAKNMKVRKIGTKFVYYYCDRIEDNKNCIFNQHCPKLSIEEIKQKYREEDY